MKYFAYFFVGLLIVGIIGGLLESFHIAGDDISIFLRVLCVVLSIMLYHVGKYLYYRHDNVGGERTNTRSQNVESVDVETNNSNIEQEKGKTMNEEEKTGERTVQDTKELVERVLKELGCQTQENEDGGLVFRYQGQTFVIKAQTEFFAWVNTYWWNSLSLDDPDVESLKEAVNVANMKSAIQNYYTFDSKQGYMGLHCQLAAYISEDIPHITDYFELLFRTFFSAQKIVQDEFLNIRKLKVNTDRIHVKGFC